MSILVVVTVINSNTTFFTFIQLDATKPFRITATTFGYIANKNATAI